MRRGLGHPSLPHLLTRSYSLPPTLQLVVRRRPLSLSLDARFTPKGSLVEGHRGRDRDFCTLTLCNNSSSFSHELNQKAMREPTNGTREERACQLRIARFLVRMFPSARYGMRMDLYSSVHTQNRRRECEERTASKMLSERQTTMTMTPATSKHLAAALLAASLQSDSSVFG